MEKFLGDLEYLLGIAFKWYLRAFLVFLAFIGLLLVTLMMVS